MEVGSINVFCDSYVNVPSGNVKGGAGYPSETDDNDTKGGNGGDGQFLVHIITSTKDLVSCI